MDNETPQSKSAKESDDVLDSILLPTEVKPPKKYESESYYARPDPTPFWKIVLEVGAITIACVLAWIYHGQLEAMRGQLEQMRGAGTQTDKLIRLYQEQLAQLTKQVSDTHELAIQAKNQADMTKDLARSAEEQARANKRAANAAVSAADTAKETLYVSQRAYVVIGDPGFNYSTKFMDIPVINVGHIPSGEITVVVHEATFNQPVEGHTDSRYVVEKHWQHHPLNTITPNNPIALSVPVFALDKEKLEKGEQRIVVGGTITYGDGFPDRPKQVWQFCVASSYSIPSKKTTLTPCDPRISIPFLEYIDGYPNNEAPP